MRRSDPPQFLAIGTPLLPRDQLLARVRERTAAKKAYEQQMDVDANTMSNREFALKYGIKTLGY